MTISTLNIKKHTNSSKTSREYVGELSLFMYHSQNAINTVTVCMINDTNSKGVLWPSFCCFWSTYSFITTAFYYTELVSVKPYVQYGIVDVSFLCLPVMRLQFVGPAEMNIQNKRTCRILLNG